MCEIDYLSDLLREKKQLELFPALFPHADRLVDGELARVRSKIFHADFYSECMGKLPEPMGELVMAVDKVYVPANEHPGYNFVGRILGPRGMTAKELERETGCKIMIRGKGSMRDPIKERKSHGRPNYEHLDDDLHVLIQCEDTKERAAIKLASAVDQVSKLLVPPKDKGIDELKRKQLMELAILNGTYRPPPNHQKRRPLQAQSMTSMPPPLPFAMTPPSPNGGAAYIPPARRRSQLLEFSTPPPPLHYYPSQPQPSPMDTDLARALEDLKLKDLMDQMMLTGGCGGGGGGMSSPKCAYSPPHYVSTPMGCLKTETYRDSMEQRASNVTTSSGDTGCFSSSPPHSPEGTQDGSYTEYSLMPPLFFN